MPFLITFFVLFFAIPAFAGVSLEDAKAHDKLLRFSETTKIIKSAENLAKQSKVRQAIELVQYLKKHLVVFEPNSGYKDFSINPIESSSDKNFIGVAMLLPSDRYLSRKWESFYSNDMMAAAYSYEQKALLVKQDAFGKIFQTLVFIHEGFHAYEYARKNYVDFKTNGENCQNEVEAYELELKLMEAIGGNDYREARNEKTVSLENTFKKMRVPQGSMPFEMPNYNQYDRRLDKFLGVPKSRLEESTRTSLIWVGANFQIIEKRDAKNALMQKTILICKVEGLQY